MRMPEMQTIAGVNRERSFERLTRPGSGTTVGLRRHSQKGGSMKVTVFGGGGRSTYVRPVGLVHSSNPSPCCTTCHGV